MKETKNHLCTQSSGYGSYNPYGSVGYAGSIDRRGMRDGLYPGTDPYGRRGGYDHGGYGGGGVDDKWRNTYPYVPTSYNYHHNSRYSVFFY